MTEAILKSKLAALLREQLKPWVVLRHEDRITSGIPDISVTGQGRTTWWEIKHGNPDFKCPGIQELTALRFAAIGAACYFVVYYTGRDKKTAVYIVEPKNLGEWMNSEVKADGYNHRFVVDFVRGVHLK